MQKSGKVKLRLKNKMQWDKKIILPLAGETIVNEDGEIEIEDTVATLLLEKTKMFDLVDGNGTTVTDAPDDEEEDEDSDEDSEDTTEEDEADSDTAEEEDEDSDEEGEDEDVEITKESLEELKSLKELYAVAKELGFKPKDYEKFKKSKKMMISFILKNKK